MSDYDSINSSDDLHSSELCERCHRREHTTAIWPIGEPTCSFIEMIEKYMRFWCARCANEASREEWPMYPMHKRKLRNGILSSSFVAWIKQQVDRRDIVGDLARDVMSRHFNGEQKPPPHAKPSIHDYDRWHSYLISHQACSGAFDALRQAYLEFLSLSGIDMEIPLDEEFCEDDEDCEIFNSNERILSSSRSISLHMRFEIFKRDNYRCRICGATTRSGNDVRLEVDHITPRSKGGTDDRSNLQTLCFECNRGKGTKEL